MNVGLNGEKGPANTLANAMPVARFATGEAEERYVDQAKRKAGPAGGKAPRRLAKRRREIAKTGANARWG